ncbi:D-alanyl-D-alanine carboxypeptidase family protein [Anaerococcus provencensis]|uniref:D-alanyl-D-alanine carboxypeptidase family protein n=1 Tax=Anaerococcus provencensis TaxID=938293 RepID=UPI0002FA14DF|nr:D-alanyl-D-alanine carboxypeptidase family protein [Anaerococcus provencensis]
MRKNKISSIIVVLLILLFPINALAANQSQVVGLDQNVRAYIIGNEENGDIYYEKDSSTPYPIASLSKLMTYLIVKEKIDDGKLSLDQEVTVGEEAAKFHSWEYSYLGLDEGEVYTIEELLQGLMVVSGNDCAYQLAVTVSDSESEFARLMNMKAGELGLDSQVYYNASGVQTESGNQNSSSAKDLYVLSKYIIEKYPEVLEYSKVRKIEDKRREIDVNSTIPLIGEIPGVDGLKTGSTEEAGYCLVSTVDMKEIDSKDDFRTIAVLLGADQKDTRDKAMSDLIYYVSRYYDKVKVLDTNVAYDSLKVNTAKQGYVELYPNQNVEMIVKTGENPAVKTKLQENIKTPIKSGQVLGNANVSYEDKEYDVSLISKSNLEEASLFARIVRSLQDSADFLLKVLIAR